MSWQVGVVLIALGICAVVITFLTRNDRRWRSIRFGVFVERHYEEEPDDSEGDA